MRVGLPQQRGEFVLGGFIKAKGFRRAKDQDAGHSGRGHARHIRSAKTKIIKAPFFEARVRGTVTAEWIARDEVIGTRIGAERYLLEEPIIQPRAQFGTERDGEHQRGQPQQLLHACPHAVVVRIRCRGPA